MQTRSGFSSHKICIKFKTNDLSSPWHTCKTFLQKKKTFPQHSSQAKKCQQGAPVKSRALNSVLLSAWPVKKSTSSIVLYRGGGAKERTLLTSSIPPSNPLNPIWPEVIYSFVKSTPSAPWSLKLKARKSKRFTWPKQSPFQGARLRHAFWHFLKQHKAHPKHVFLFYCQRRYILLKLIVWSWRKWHGQDHWLIIQTLFSRCGIIKAILKKKN